MVRDSTPYHVNAIDKLIPISGDEAIAESDNSI